MKHLLILKNTGAQLGQLVNWYYVFFLTDLNIDDSTLVTYIVH